jgi:hypothetical protein
VLVTNPPFSGTHLGRILRFCAASGKPWMLLVRRRSSPRSDRAVNTRGEHPRAVHSTHSQRPRGRLRCVWSFRHHSRGKYWRVPFERSKTGANNSKRIVGAELCLPQALLPPRARRRAVRVGGTLSGPSRGILGGISVPHSESVLYGVFVRAHRVLNSRKRWFPARAVAPPTKYVFDKRAGGGSGGGLQNAPYHCLWHVCGAEVRAQQPRAARRTRR